MENEGESVKCEVTSVTKKEGAGAQKKCLICGDKALGYNFNAITCESCKAFFRRNALTNKEFKCPFSNNCEITVVTRRFCQKCRLEKCLAVGMVKEFIMSDEDKAEKRRKIEENRARKRQMLDPDDHVSSSKIRKEDISNIQESVQYNVLNSTTCSPQSTVQSPSNTDVESSLSSPPFYPYPVPEETQYMKVPPIDEKTVLNRTLYEQRVFEQFPSSSEAVDSMYAEPPKQNSMSFRSLLTNNDNLTNKASDEHVSEDLPSTSNDADENMAREILQDVERIEPNSMESILCEVIKLEFEGYPALKNCSGTSKELNEVERSKLNELILANKALHAPIDDDLSLLIGDITQNGDTKHDPRLVTIVNLTAVAIRRFIKMAKKINAFKNMCEEDQVALLKGGCIEMLVLRSAMTYDGQHNQWKLPHSQERFGSIRTEVLKLARGDMYREHQAFISSFSAAHRTDEHLIVILSAILLFSPDRPRVVHRDVVKLEQNSYYYLLRRYLEARHAGAGCEARAAFVSLVRTAAELRRFAARVTGVFLDVSPLEPLLVEILDLKHRAA